MDVIRFVMALKLIMVQQLVVAQEPMQRIIEGPEDQTVILGQTIRLRCKVEFQHGPVTWTKRFFLLGSERSLPAYPRYAMVGSSVEGEYHLEIQDVQLSDEDTYQCQIAATAKQPAQTSKIVKLTILVPPSRPRFFNDHRTITGREGHSVSTKCSVLGGKPAAAIEWLLAGDEQGSNVIRRFDAADVPMLVSSRGDLYDVESSIRFAAQSDDDGKYLICAARHSAIEGIMTSAAQLKIRSKPKVSLKLNSSEPLRENGAAMLLCEVESNAGDPQDLHFKWFHNNVEILGANDASLILPRINRTLHHETFYVCKVSNDVGEGHDKLKLEIHFAPYFKSDAQPQPLMVRKGETVKFHCLVEAKSAAKYTWTKLDQPHFQEVVGNNLTFENVSSSHEGQYKCDAQVEGFPSISQVWSLRIKDLPRVEISNTPGAVEGGSATISCRISGYPKPPLQNVTWSKGGSIINPMLNQRYNITMFSHNEDELLTVLTIKKAFGADFDMYYCSAVNEIGPASAHTKLVESNAFPLYVMIPGVAGGCVAILVIAIAIVWANRKYLCRSKSSTLGDDHSDVIVKLEALDANGMPCPYFPDMYNSGPTDGVDLLYNNSKDYFSIPQDNPDFDLLPPPYPSYHMPNSTFSNGGHQNGHVVHVTYIDDAMQPRNAVHHLSNHSDNSLGSPYGYSGYSDNNAMYHPFTGYGDQAPYYPSGVHQLPLEPVQEVPTPDTLDDRNVSSSLPRCPSQISTHV